MKNVHREVLLLVKLHVSASYIDQPTEFFQTFSQNFTLICFPEHLFMAASHVMCLSLKILAQRYTYRSQPYTYVKVHESYAWSEITSTF